MKLIHGNRVAPTNTHNAFRHAEAKVIEVEITYRDGLRVGIRDDGTGIDPEIAKEGAPTISVCPECASAPCGSGGR
jgi:nitrate/nitrite-specific signal transduction histidine kinase